MSSTTPVPKKMKVAELRIELDKRGLPTTGLRAELVHRLEAALDEEEFGAGIADMHESNPEEPESTKLSESSPQKSTTSTLSAPIATKKSVAKTNSTSGTVAKAIAPAVQAKEVTAVKEKGTDEKKVENKEIKSTINNAIAANGDTDKMKARAARFGLPISNEEKMSERAKRFKITPSDSEALAERERLIKRSERFGVVSKETLELKKQQRAERFGNTVDKQRLKNRAERFGLCTADDLEEKKKQRARRFAIESQLPA